MKDPPRLLDHTNDELVSTMLRAARDEAPPGRSMQSTIAAVGAGGVLLGASKTATGAAVTAKLGGLALVKWAGSGVVVGLVVFGGYQTLGSGSDEPARAPAKEQVNVSAAEPRAQGAPMAVAGAAEETEPGARDQAVEPRPKNDPEPKSLVPSIRSFRAGPAEARPESGAVGAFPDAFEAERDSELAREVRLLDEARQLLSAGDGSGTLAALGRYRREATTHRLAPEALYLEMEAHAAAGDTGRARAAAKTLLGRYPQGPHAARAQQLLSEAK